MRRRLPFALALAATLSACAGVPSSGPVVRGARVDAIRNDGYVRVIARPPKVGMDAEALVRGFLSASASLPDGDETARQYLTHDASAQWRPASRTDVYDAAALTVTLERDDLVRFTAPLVGTIDSRRRYHIAEQGSVLTVDLRVSKRDGEWRIAEPPPALYLGEGDVTRSLRAHPVFYLTDSGSRLVPEYVMLPVGVGNVTALLMRQLMRGPASEALHTAIPQGSRLAFATAIPEIGVASVGLGPATLRLSPDVRQSLLAQVVWTLTDLTNVNYVSVSVDGVPLESTDGSSSLVRKDFPRFAGSADLKPPPLFFVRGTAFWTLAGGTLRQLRSELSASEAMVSADGATIVGVGANRQLLFVSTAGRTPEYVVAGDDLASADIDTEGTVWFVDRERRAGLATWDAVNGERPVRIALGPRARILDFAMAPDLARVAMIVHDGVTTTVRIGIASSDVSGYRVTDIQRIEQRLTSAVAIAWQSDSDLVVLGAVGAVAAQPIGIALPLGTLTLFGGPANAVALAAAPGAAMVVADQSGQLWRFDSGKWSASELGSAPSYGH